MTPDWQHASFLYQTQGIFKQIVDECQEVILSDLKIDLGNFFARQNYQDYELRLILFTLEYALCNLLKSWGIMPTVVIGNDVGQWVAATVTGVINLTDSLRGVIGQKKLILLLLLRQNFYFLEGRDFKPNFSVSVSSCAKLITHIILTAL